MAEPHAIQTAGILQLPLTGRRNHRQGVVVGYTQVLDDEFTHAFLVPHSWHIQVGYTGTDRRRKHHGVYRSTKQGEGPIRTILLHREIFEHYHGPIPPGLCIDHINRNPFYNLPDNLRAVTWGVNIANSGLRRNNRSGFNGVSWSAQRNKWTAHIGIGGKSIALGRFPLAVQAARAVNAAYRIHFPEVPIPNPEAENGA